MPIGRGGGVSLVGEDDGEGLTLSSETAVETPAVDVGETNGGLPVTSLSDGWAIGG